MGRMPRATYLWPGLPQIWKRGAWSALALAVGFALLVNAALVVSFLWSELLPHGARTILWVVVGLIWSGSAVTACFRNSQERTIRAEQDRIINDPYPEALDHYLKGNWFEAECVLGELLRRNPRDLEAGLLLATLLRHTGRFDEAAGQLERLGRFEGCEKWELEIGRERRLLDEAQHTQTCQPVESPNGE